MINEEDIKSKMSACEEEFNKLGDQMQQLANQYESMRQRREQIRGEYTAYYNLIEGTESSADEVLPIEKHDSEDNTNTATKENVDSNPKVAETKSAEEKKVEEIVAEVTEQKVEDDTPEYLK